MIINQTPSRAEEILHYGVKGMQWGVKKAHPSYSGDSQREDRKKFGKRGVKRINRNIHRGATRDDAIEFEKSRRLKVRVIGGLVVANALYTAANLALPSLQNAANARVASSGARAAANVMANKRGLPGGGFVNLTYNAAKNVWE